MIHALISPAFRAEMRAVAGTDWLRNCLVAPLVVVVVVAFVLVAQAQTQSSFDSAGGVKAEEEELSEEVNDPTAMLAQVRLLDFYTPGNFQTSSQTNATLIQPIIPIARLPFLPFEQIIRPTFKLSLVAPGPGAHPVTAFADTQLYDLFQSQWPHLDRWKLRWAIGSTFVFPNATDHRAGGGLVASGASSCGRVCGRTRSLAGISGSESDFVRIHASRSQTSEYHALPARILVPVVQRMVFEVDRFRLDDKLAAPYIDIDSG